MFLRCVPVQLFGPNTGDVRRHKSRPPSPLFLWCRFGVSQDTVLFWAKCYGMLVWKVNWYLEGCLWILFWYFLLLTFCNCYKGQLMFLMQLNLIAIASLLLCMQEHSTENYNLSLNLHLLCICCVNVTRFQSPALWKPQEYKKFFPWRKKTFPPNCENYLIVI